MTAERLRTIVYVDGFNLYFGCLKRAPQYRWLDVAALASRLCHEQNPSSEIVGVKYFSAPIKAKLSPRGNDSCKAQSDYWLALRAHSPALEIIEGLYIEHHGCRVVLISDDARLLPHVSAYTRESARLNRTRIDLSA